MNTQRKNSLLLLLCAFIWGTAFVAQSAGSGMGACSFLAGRSWLAVLVLLPTVKVFDLVRQRSTGTTGAPKTPEERRYLRRASLVCGTLLFVASAAQQFGLTLNPSTAKAGFLTAMYVVLVPIFGLALGRRGSPQLWLSVAIAVCLLLVKPQFESAHDETDRGIVRDESVRLRVVKEVSDAFAAVGFSIEGAVESPIKGAEGNVEYLVKAVYQA